MLLQEDSIVGVIGLEPFGSEALLRSLAVATEQAKRGVSFALPRLGRLHEQNTLLVSIIMAGRIYNVLFLCTGNSARSILAEAILNRRGNGHFRGFSAGSFLKAAVHRLALELLKQFGMPVEGLRSKSWDEFAAPGAPPPDFIITVCDNAAGEVCPMWPGRPITAHWGIPDPAVVQGSDIDKKAAFVRAFKAMDRRIKLFLSLPLSRIDDLRIKQETDAIGKTRDVE